MSRFQRFLRVCGLKFVPPYRPIRRPVFSPDESLELRIAMQRDLIGPREITPVLRVPEKVQTASCEPKAVDFEGGLPIG
jgi:hypothetical protein